MHRLWNKWKEGYSSLVLQTAIIWKFNVFSWFFTFFEKLKEFPYIFDEAISWKHCFLSLIYLQKRLRQRSQICLVRVSWPTQFLFQSSSRRVGVHKNWKITEEQLYSNQSLVGNSNWHNFDLRQFQKLNKSQISFIFKLDALCDGD